MDLDYIDVLEVEKKPQHFRVVFETSGEPFGQQYPKRLSHNFPLDKAFLHRNSDGLYRFEWKLQGTYLGYSRDRERFNPDEKCTDLESELETVKNVVVGKTLQ